jgi:hypothetical protein
MYAKKYVYIKAFSHRAVHIYFFLQYKKKVAYTLEDFPVVIREHT